MKKYHLHKISYTPVICFLLIINCENQPSNILTNNSLKDVSTESIVIGGLHDFRLGLHLSDAYPGGYDGDIVYCQYVNTSPTGLWSNWCFDANCYDPDYVRICLDLDSDYHNCKDFRIWIQVVDQAGNATPGTARCTPWASQGGGFSAWAGDGNLYNPDGIRIKIETRNITVSLEDVRIGIQCAEQRSEPVPYQVGGWEYTPWASNSGGWSEWNSDSNEENPDVFRLALDVILESNAEE